MVLVSLVRVLVFLVLRSITLLYPVGKHIATALSRASSAGAVTHQIQLASLHPEKLYSALKSTHGIIPPATIDITDESTLLPAFSGASLVVSLVGIMHGSPEDFDRIQWKGAENVAKAAKEAGARLVHVSAIGADRASDIPYNRTKALGEEAVRDAYRGKAEKDVVVLRPSIVFGPEDDFFNVSFIFNLMSLHPRLNIKYKSDSPICLSTSRSYPFLEAESPASNLYTLGILRAPSK